MLFENTKCNHCEKEYDRSLAVCPKCGNINDFRFETLKKSKLLWLPLMYQVGCFLLGLVGLEFFRVIAQYAFLGIYNPDNKIPFFASVNFTSYFILFACFIVIILLQYKNVILSFKNIKNYGYGVLFGIGLIVFSILYGLFTEAVYPTVPSDNEIMAQQLTVAYPALSIIVLGIIGPICEEFTYRVGLFTLASRINRIFAYVITSLIFGIIHFSFQSDDIIKELIYLPNYIIAGVILATSYDYKGLSCSLTAHIINNLYSVVGVLIINGIK